MLKTLSDALAEQGYDTLTPVQEAVTAPELAKADLLVSAQTGSGKTVGFGLAIAPTLLGEQEHFGPAGTPLALIIAPTRELAQQVARELSWLYAKAGAVVISCVGGMDTRTERRALDRGAHVVVATPGRLCDHIKRGNIELSGLRAVVLDEADEMLDLGFREELEFILDEAPTDRRTLLFSATVPKAIAKLAESYQRDAQRIETVSETRQHADIEYRALNTHPRDVENAIINVLRFYEAKNAIVFCNTRAAVARLTTRFTNRGFSVVALSGELTQSERSNALQALRDGRARVCVATDVAARGIDLPNLELVIHADLPSNSDTLLHRSGRTGRAGRKGVSALIVPPKLRTKANRLLGWAKLKAEWGTPPSAAEVNAQDTARLLSDPLWNATVSEEAEELVAQLAQDFSATQLAQAVVSFYQAQRSAPEELTDPTTPDDRPRKTFGPSVWFSVSVGRDAGAEPRTLLPMICNKGDMTKDDIGAIRIRQDQSFVEVLASRADGLVAALGSDMTLEAGVVLTRLAQAPDLGQDRPGTSKPGAKPHRKKRPEDRDARPERAARPARAASPAQDARKDKPHKPAAAAKGKKPPKSHKTERSPMKPGAAPKPKSTRGENPDRKPGKAKAVWTKDARDTARAEKVTRDKAHREDSGAGRPTAKGGPRKDPSASKKRAADTSKRFVPPHKRGKSTGKGPNARPQRKG
ncbi:ATP-dependent RNA helicase [Roseobacter denitrificans]|uniref:DEAD/DEAH box helicase n=1 Tax=Roseobacter denitrificans TaxID=2434 RepID=UPI0002D5151B|nr:DEAD/DEAH box helicase [Roseobacter denitrificans]AVL53784.1 ATP-dependent RNA helicase [Roseobacter denitrificans]SFG18915.1 ATP-dependent RNA helicase DeaD [Roseobacter denitrificans OCh 114]